MEVLCEHSARSLCCASEVTFRVATEPISRIPRPLQFNAACQRIPPSYHDLSAAIDFRSMALRQSKCVCSPPERVLDGVPHRSIAHRGRRARSRSGAGLRLTHPARTFGGAASTALWNWSSAKRATDGGRPERYVQRTIAAHDHYTLISIGLHVPRLPPNTPLQQTNAPSIVVH
jgi:hypothetical protein